MAQKKGKLTTMIRVSKEAHTLIESNKRDGESQSDCIKRIFQEVNSEISDTQFDYVGNSYKETFEGGFTLMGYRETEFDRNNSHIMKNRQPDFVKGYQVLLKKDQREFAVGPVSSDDLEKMKGSKNIWVEFLTGMPHLAFVPHQ